MYKVTVTVTKCLPNSRRYPSWAMSQIGSKVNFLKGQKIKREKQPWNPRTSLACQSGFSEVESWPRCSLLNMSNFREHQHHQCNAAVTGQDKKEHSIILCETREHEHCPHPRMSKHPCILANECCHSTADSVSLHST